MQVNFIKGFDDASVDAKVVFVYKDYDKNLIPESVEKSLEVLKERETFEFGPAEISRFCLDGTRFYVCSMGVDSEKAVADDLRFTAYKLFVEVKKERYAEISVAVQSGAIEKAHAYSMLSEMASTSEYTFDRFKTKRKENRFVKMNIVDKDASAGLNAAVEEGKILGEAVKSARFLVDEPANLLTPEALAEKTIELGKTHGFDVEVMDKKQIEKLGMKAYLAVSKGSNNPPKLIVMRYRGAGKGSKNYGLVGKGLCYDSGGYSLKPSDGMMTMKLDMGGAATVIGAMQAIAAAKLPVNVTAVVAACQNLIGPDAYFPGDILESMGGKTIFIGNTDAEGRLTLIDAITYIIRNEKVDTVFDYATLTGAAMRAFGSACAASVSNNDEIYTEYEEACKLAGEKIWRMPIFREYKEHLKHKEADLTNMAGGPGMITAGMFVGEFIENDLPWIHVDIAPIAFMDKPTGYYDAGGTGYGVKSVYEFMKMKS